MKLQFIFILFCLSIAFPFQGLAQMVSVSGYVKNQLSGEAQKNTAVYESVSGFGTITNSEGYYRLLLKPGPQKLKFSSPGFNDFMSEFNLVSDTTLTIELIPNNFQETKSETRSGHESDLNVTAESGFVTGKRSRK